MIWFRVAVAICATAIGGEAALAQDTQAAPALQEIVVTARKSTEKLLTVPVAITAFTAKDIEAAGIRDLRDVAALTPGLVFDTLIGEYLAIPTIRGLTQNDLFGDVNNVEIFLDGINVSGRSGLNFNLLDVERIEVVKGPQSALYGRNSFAGAINFVSRRAPSAFEGRVSATAGSDGTRRGALHLGGPLTDTLNGRLSIGYDGFDGSYENYSSPGSKLGGHKYRTYSGGLDWAPTANFGLRLNAYYSDDQIGAPAVGFTAQNCEPNAAGLAQAFCGKLPEAVPTALGSDPRASGEVRKVFRTSLQADWTTGIGQLTSLTGYNTLRHDALSDATRLVGPASWYYLGRLPSNAVVPQVFTSKLFRGDVDDVNEFSQELRLEGKSKGLRWTAGLFYYSQDYKGGLDAGALGTLPANFVGFLPPFFTAIASPWFVTDGLPPFSRFERKTDSSAVFGALEFDFTDRLRGRAEGRFTHEGKTQTTPIKDGRVIANARSFSDSWSFFTPRFTIDYRTPGDLLIYTSAAKGVKAGGFNENASVAAEESFKPEQNWTYEVGTKGSLLDGRVTFNAALFYVDWTSMQLPALSPSASVPQTVTLNVGSASSKGLELSLSAALTRSLTASLGYSYTRAQFDSAFNRGLIALPSFAATGGNISGFDLPRTSPTQWNLALDYKRPAFAGYNFFGRVDYSYKSTQKPMADGLAETGAMKRVNARVGLESEAWRFEFWGDNLTNDATPTGAFRDTWLNNYVDNQLALFLNRTSTSYPRLRTYGVTASYRF
ncbi:MAG: TonB-dependent receptor [Burkholderiaceae bacterium]|jgi:iron complex outermembrane receptor protein|nr:TonB-dependent receptor [Burkholderiaceae bacterium]